MVDVIKVFIRNERLADHNGHLCCIVSRKLDIFAAAGHHQYAKGARLYCQLMKQLETLPAYKETFESFTAHGNHVVRYSSHDWSGTWCDICIEQTLMKSAKSEGGLSRGRMRHSDSGHKCWVLTLNHFSNVNQRMEESVKKHAPLHRDLGKTQMKRDAEAIDLAIQWFEENNPFDPDRDKELLLSFSTGFRSTGDDPVIAERAAEIGREMQIKLDGQSVTSTMEVKSKVQALSSLRKIPKINEMKIHLDSLKLFNRLIIFAIRSAKLSLKERDATCSFVKPSLVVIRFCAGDIDEHMDIFLDTQATKDAVIQAGTTIFQYIYHAPGTALGEIRHNMFSRKAAAGLIKPETLPPTEGAAAQHSLRAYLQTQDWILLQSMSLNPSDYGWTLGVHGYEPVPTLDPMAPEELLQFTSCNCNGDCSNRRCSCKRNGVKCISACGVCKGISCNNCGHDGGESGEDSEIDS
ncbi:hypothetical protein F7725_012964 [Dissostichus mawsoni]|uniref:Tesmin/TSO1-like CXC domain-containing protein n=1 Tax=Dissostichus mawsoni TaxID=36200 RepID=A0A7J5YNR0_DISMA|nr:hypothetical protein F7725_012964 [Dissostichus mawsoni]